MNNLRLLGGALQRYTAKHKCLPPAAYWTTEGLETDKIYKSDAVWPNITAVPPGTYKDTTYANWVILLLPELGYEALAAQGDGSVPISDPRNRALRTTSLPSLQCPSDSYHRPDNQFLRVLADGSRTKYARGNYAINGGSQRDCQVPGQSADPCTDGFHYRFEPATRRFQWWGNGVAGINKSLAPSDCVAGLATTVALEEVRAGIHARDPRGVWALGQIGGSITWAHGINGDAGAPNCTNDRSDDIAGCGELHKLVGSQRLLAEKMTCCWYCEGNLQATARSMHPGGVNTLMMDGSGRFVTDAVDRCVWHLIHSRENHIDLSGADGW
jgi:prepilin-type processing-associated H-X9-DG protein